MRNRTKDKKCPICKQLTPWLTTFNHAPYNEEWNDSYCLGCIWALEKDYRIPGLERVKLCAQCGEIFPVKHLHIHKKIATTGYGFCQPCLDQLIDEHSITCTECGDKTVYYPYHTPTVCDNCYTKNPFHRTVYQHNFRAKTLGLPATLTAQQWEVTILHFNNKCAYCQQRPYQVLEHFYPLAVKKGTTADNCLPSCSRCNGMKSRKHPNDFEQFFPVENIARIKAYFASL
jgi:HNH endonuclease